MPVAMILVDALSAYYPTTGALPLLGEIARDGVATPLQNIYAYRGIEATLFTGRRLDEHGVWGEFRPSPHPQFGGVLGKMNRAMIGVGDVLPSDRLRLDVRYVAARLQRTSHLPTGNLIPAGVMPFFTGSIESEIWKRDCLPVPTLFDEISRAGGSFETIVYPAVSRDEHVMGRVAERLQAGNLPDFWYIKFSALDALGHKYGPGSLKLQPALRLLNTQLAGVTLALRKTYGSDLDVVIVSDHGMSAVTRSLDVRSVFASTGLKPGRDYLYFLDSTTVRIWSHSPSALKRLNQAFNRVPGMHVLDAEGRASLHLPQDDSTGDILVALDEGVSVFPDFFRRDAAPLGMHGYARVETTEGLPYLAADARIAELLDHAPDRRPGHAGVWAAMRNRLGLSAPAPFEDPQKEAALCMC